jgi:hypothetical protein
MQPDLEIIIPVRNPTEVFMKTIDSLAAQSDRGIRVLISDNHSTAGSEWIDRARQTLEAASIPVQFVQPRIEVGRVEHWNWSHRQSDAEWIKPLFVGDWLDVQYVAATKAAIVARPEVEIVHCSTGIHQSDGTRSDTVYPGGFRTPEQVLAAAFAGGNAFGGPVNICFRREAFDLVGGYPPALPISADFWLILMLALRHGLATCPEVLVHFNYHPARFSSNFPTKRIHGPREFLVILMAATSYACFHEIPHETGPRNRLFLRLLRDMIKARLRKKAA